MAKNRYNIAVIPGDGIGKEVVPEALKVLEKIAGKHDINLHFDHFDFSSYDYFSKHGQMMPDDWKLQIGSHDALFFGAVGWPEKIPDHISLWGSLLKFRREFDQYINIRPVKLMPGVPSPLANRNPGDINFYIIRENTEGEYSSIGGRMFPDTEREIVLQETVMSRVGVDRVLKFAFELAQKTEKKHLTSATKSNGISITMPYWDERVEEMAKQYSDVIWDKYHIDILCAHFVLNPDKFNVVVASNLFGDILSDISAMITGSLGMLPSASIGDSHSMYEPVHGSAPDSAGKGLANPLAQFLSFAMMLRYSFDQADEADLVEKAVNIALESKRTGDIMAPGCEQTGTDGMTKAVLDAMDRLARQTTPPYLFLAEI